MENRWIRSARWDLTWLTLSVLVVPLAPLLFHFGLAASTVAAIVMLTVGGPHVFVTFTRTNMDPKFVRNHKLYSRLAYLVPFATAAFVLISLPAFLTFFFTWASLHVLQQIAYVANCYSNRQNLAPTRFERWTEYGLIFSCLYPFATVRMVRHEFKLDGESLIVPDAILGPGLVWAAFGIFGAFLLAWIIFSVRRYRAGTLHYGKTALLAATVGATFFTPLFPNLDVAFQGINAWHCVQYLALVWWTNRIRTDRGETEFGFVRALSGAGVRGFFRYYFAAVAGTALVIGIVTVISALLPKAAAGQSHGLLIYYMIANGLLLTHYYYDTFLFTQRDELTTPIPAGAAVAAA